MTDINHVTLLGRLVKDPEYRQIGNGNTVANFSVAVNKPKKEGESWTEEGHFFDVALFGRQADAIRSYLVKGKQIALDGNLHQSRWETDDGQKRSRVIIRANSVQLLGGKSDSESQPGAPSYYEKQSNPKPQPAFESNSENDGFDDDIPF